MSLCLGECGGAGPPGTHGSRPGTNVYTGVPVPPPGRSRHTEGSRAWGLLTAPMPGPQAVRPRGPSYPPPARPPHTARGQAAGLGHRAERPPLGHLLAARQEKGPQRATSGLQGDRETFTQQVGGAHGPQGSMTFNLDAPPAPEAAGLARLQQLGTTPHPGDLRSGGEAGILQERLASGLPGQGDHLR